MKPVREVISREIIDDLWGAGYTILPRNRHPDPFFVPPEMVPHGRSYQWWHLVHDKFHFERNGNSGWAPVPASRHDGYFMPAGFVGDIEVSGLGLFEKSKVEVDQEHASNIAAANQKVIDWHEKWGGKLFGEVTVGGETTQVGDVHANPKTKTVNLTTAIPRELMPYIDKILAERDRLAQQYADEANTGDHIWSSHIMEGFNILMEAALCANPDAPKWPTLHAIVMPTAIENIRKEIKETAK